MKPRTLRTYKILAVAVAATAGCTPTAGAGPVTSAETAAAAAPTVVVPPADTAAAPDAPQAAAPAMATPAGPAPQAVAPAQAASHVASNLAPGSTDPALNTLLAELLKEGRDHVMSRTAKFRPLCDKDGYPLVGNVIRKGPSPEFQPSHFCAEIRSRGGAR